MMVKRYMFVTVAALVLTGHAATVTWDGGGGGARSWMEASNWNPDAVPTAGNDYLMTVTGPADVRQADFAGDSLTLSGGILRYVDGSNVWNINTVTNSGGIIRNQNTGLTTSGTITDLTLTGTSRFLVDKATSSLSLDIGTLTFASATQSYSYGAGSLTLNIANISASNEEVFRIDGGIFDFDGAADTQVIGLNINGGQYVLDEARNFASLEIGGTTFGEGTYDYGDFTASQQALLVDAGGSITVIPEPASLGMLSLSSAMLFLVRRIFSV